MYNNNDDDGVDDNETFVYRDNSNSTKKIDDDTWVVITTNKNTKIISNPSIIANIIDGITTTTDTIVDMTSDVVGLIKQVLKIWWIHNKKYIVGKSNTRQANKLW